MKGEKKKMKENDKIEVLYIEPMKKARFIEIGENLASMQETVGGMIEEYMPFEDEVAIVCNEEGKLRGMELNRAIFNEDGNLQDIICGSFFICYAPIDSERFMSFPEELKTKYEEKFRWPQQFFRNGNEITVRNLEPKETEMER